MKRALILIAAVTAAASCSRKEPQTPATPPAEASPEAASEAPSVAAHPVIEQLWIAKGFDSPEGVAPSADGAYFISNVGGEETDGDGFISKLSADGAIITERFIDGLDGPKGMAVNDGFLYVTDTVRVRTFDAATGEAGAVIEIPDAKFLNDATIWNDEVYISDSGTARIWRLSAEGPVVWREGEELRGVNGLLGVGDVMLISTMTTGSLFEATADGGWREIADGMTNADGIGVVPDNLGGGYLVSSWPGEIHHVAPDGAVTTLLNMRIEEIYQNDLTMFGDIVIVPNWVPGTVTAWRVKAAN